MNKKALITKSNKLVEASYRLSLTEKRILIYAIAQYRQQNVPNWTNGVCLVSPKEYATLFNIKDRNLYASLKEATYKLFTREVTIPEIHPVTKKEHSIKTRWITEQSTCDDIGYIHIVFHDRVIPYFHDLQDSFTYYDIEQVSKFNNVYAIRLYELLKQREDFNSRKLSVAQLRQLFELEDSEYVQLNDFKRRVIDASVKQINQHTDLKVGYTKIKQGRYVTDFKFRVDLKTPKITKLKGRQSAMRLKTEQSPSDATHASQAPATPPVMGKQNPQALAELMTKLNMKKE